MVKLDRLVIRKFAQVDSAEFAFGDLTVLVGAQGTGKSLALQWLKVALDGKQIVKALAEAGHDTKNPKTLIDLIFGVGMGAAWDSSTEVLLNGKRITPESIGRRGKGEERAFFIPAHRAVPLTETLTALQM